MSSSLLLHRYEICTVNAGFRLRNFHASRTLFIWHEWDVIRLQAPDATEVSDNIVVISGLPSGTPIDHILHLFGTNYASVQDGTSSSIKNVVIHPPPDDVNLPDAGDQMALRVQFCSFSLASDAIRRYHKKNIFKPRPRAPLQIIDPEQPRIHTVGLVWQHALSLTFAPPTGDTPKPNPARSSPAKGSSASQPPLSAKVRIQGVDMPELPVPAYPAHVAPIVEHHLQRIQAWAARRLRTSIDRVAYVDVSCTTSVVCIVEGSHVYDHLPFASPRCQVFKHPRARVCACA
jgi:hypothetical protein